MHSKQEVIKCSSFTAVTIVCNKFGLPVTTDDACDEIVNLYVLAASQKQLPNLRSAGKLPLNWCFLSTYRNCTPVTANKHHPVYDIQACVRLIHSHVDQTS